MSSKSGSVGLLCRTVFVAAILVAPVPPSNGVFGPELPIAAQDRGPDGRAHNPGLPGWCETPVADRKDEGGCYTTAILDLGVPPRGPIYWHLDTFPTRAAAEANRSPGSTVVDSHHRHWLFTIAEQGWRPAAGERTAMIGPLVIEPDSPYTARYLETVIPAGFQQGGPGHRHPGPEAWYVLEGGQCLETPNGVFKAGPGETMLAPDGWPMAIASLGTETRRAVVLVLHRSGEPFSMPVDARPDAPHAHWTPRGLCAK
jgi:quercetin dioxygenase-like cupin family protein